MTLTLASVLVLATVAVLVAIAVQCVRHALTTEYMHGEVCPTDGEAELTP